ncbi:hypothetical protein GQ54DRAFT_295461 [Martensiomyces pterosporus]|nr:hypothetical protein GQ54DRAFT_295461 [Martensiomyces pterosporus]
MCWLCLVRATAAVARIGVLAVAAVLVRDSFCSQRFQCCRPKLGCCGFRALCAFASLAAIAGNCAKCHCKLLQPNKKSARRI